MKKISKIISEIKYSIIQAGYWIDRSWGKLQFLKIIMLLTILIFYAFIGSVAFRFIFDMLFGKKVFSIFWLLAALFYLCLFYFILYLFVKETLRSFFKLSEKEEYVNGFLVFAVSLIILFLILGFNIIQEEYKSSYPLTTEILDYAKQYVSHSEFKCYSFQKKEVPVKDDILGCYGEIKLANDSILTDHSNFRCKILTQRYPSLQTDSKDVDCCEIIGNDTIVFKDCIYPINNTIYKTLFFRTSFNDRDSNSIDLNFRGIILDPISPEDYRVRIRDRLAVIFLLISLSFFSVLSGVNNIKNLMCRNEK